METGVEIFYTLLFWVSMAGFVFYDTNRLKQRAEEGDHEAVINIPERGMWTVIVLLFGIFALPMYMWKTRGPKGLLWAVGVFLLYGVIGSLVLPAH